MNYFVKCLRHLRVVNKHRFRVFINCCHARIPLQGLVHDLSKYSPIEFFESAKYFIGTGTPINAIKADKGYSAAWLHHKGRNPHHYEYWTDNYDSGTTTVKMPKKYAIEMVCDMIAASQTYLGKMRFTTMAPLEYFMTHQWKEAKMDPRTRDFVRECLEDYASEGECMLKTFKNKEY